MFDAFNPMRNCLLSVMSTQDLDRLSPHFEHVALDVHTFLERPGVPITHAYFPLSGLGSVVAVGSRLKDKRIETGIFGREGISGLPLLLGADRSPNEVYMQIAGDGVRVPVDALRAALAESPTMMTLLSRYVYSAHIQTSHTALANGRDTVEMRLARWILMAHDRIDGDTLKLTHEFLSLMLGVRRAGVTVNVQALDRIGLIATARGAITVIDREGLLDMVDGSYGVPEAEYERVIGVPI